MDRKHRYIIHVDGDSFFVACELLSRPDLVGKPVVTGEERGIASAMSTEAKRMGIHRGMPVFKIRKFFPQVTILRSHYELYAQYSQKMVSVARRFSNTVEEYSIDECFLDVTDTAATFTEAITIAQNLKIALKRELGLTFSVGLAHTKVLAKIASKHQKPNGFTAITATRIDVFLNEVAIGDVWGIGYRTEKKFKKYGMETALDFKNKPLSWIADNFSKPYQDLWHELCGKSVIPVHNNRAPLKSLQSTRTLPKASGNKTYLFSHLSRNIEIACARLRDNGLLTGQVSIFLKDTDFDYASIDIFLPAVTAYQGDIIPAIKNGFEHLYVNGKTYRTTGITCTQLVPSHAFQRHLFTPVEDKKSLQESLDKIRKRYGEYSLVMASSMDALRSFQLENKQKILTRPIPFCIPLLGDVY